jgi:hypothetical protein
VSIMRDPESEIRIMFTCTAASLALCRSCRVPRNPDEPYRDEAMPLLVHVRRDVLDPLD